MYFQPALAIFLNLLTIVSSASLPRQLKLVLRSGIGHDIAFGAIDPALPDFQEIGFRFSFIDRLGDGATSFGYQYSILLSPTSVISQAAVLGYGMNPVPATFEPNLEAYEFGGGDKIVFKAWGNLSSVPKFKTVFEPVGAFKGWDLVAFMKNITNQPIFGNGSDCLQQRNYFNTTLSKGDNTPIIVKGSVDVKAPYLPTDTTFKDVLGLNVDVAILENQHVPCENFQYNANVY